MVVLMLVAIISILLLGYLWKTNRYFKTRGINYDEPLLLFGNMLGSVLQKTCITDVLERGYRKFYDERYFGLFQFLEPTVIINDVELIKQIAIKDFDHFTDHQVFSREDVDPLWSKNLLATTGNKWRDMRSTLSPSFTGSKIKIMFDLINQCSEKFVDFYTDKNEAIVTVELKDIFTRFANDVIATCAFGIECDSFREEKNEFYEKGNDMTDFSGIRGLKFFGFSICPAIMKMFKIKIVGDANADFFTNLIYDTMGARKKHGIVRPDMIHLLMEVQKNRDNNTQKLAITDEDIAAQAMIFFFAGFDTVSTLLCFAAYELAANKDIQDKLKEEIDETLQECNNKLTYDALIKMKYLDNILSETLRMWPPTIITDRLCVKDYLIPAENKNEKDFVIEKGTPVWFPIFNIHRDEKHFPDPNKFLPERFSDENKGNFNHQSYMPFGVGPRICIGMRFALIETKSILLHIVNNFEIVPVKQSVIPLVLSKKHFILNAEGGMRFGLKKRV